MSMDPYSVEFCILLKELVQEGKVPMERIDDAVRRILRLKYRLGLFDQPNTGGKGYEKYGSDEFAQKALHAAEEAMVLLKNEGNILPLASSQKKILLRTSLRSTTPYMRRCAISSVRRTSRWSRA